MPDDELHEIPELTDIPEPRHTWLGYGLGHYGEMREIEPPYPEMRRAFRTQLDMSLSDIACAVCGVDAATAEPACPGPPPEGEMTHRWIALINVGMDEQEAFAWAYTHGSKLPERVPRHITEFCSYCGVAPKGAPPECTPRKRWASFGLPPRGE